MKQFLVDLLRWLIVLTMPLFLLYGTARLLIDDWYLPGFPTDPYGFTAVQRFELASIAIAYLNRPERAEEVIGMLTNQRLAGTSQLLYAEREISHMVDVKRLTDTLRRLQFVVGVISVGGLVLLLVRRSTRAAGFSALLGGVRATTALFAGLAALVLLAWTIFFTQFHELLFPPNPWTFDWSN